MKMAQPWRMFVDDIGPEIESLKLRCVSRKESCDRNVGALDKLGPFERNVKRNQFRCGTVQCGPVGRIEIRGDMKVNYQLLYPVPVFVSDVEERLNNVFGMVSNGLFYSDVVSPDPQRRGPAPS